MVVTIGIIQPLMQESSFRRFEQRINKTAFRPLKLQHNFDLIIYVLQEPLFVPLWFPPDSVRILGDLIIAEPASIMASKTNEKPKPTQSSTMVARTALEPPVLPRQPHH